MRTLSHVVRDHFTSSYCTPVTHSSARRWRSGESRTWNGARRCGSMALYRAKAALRNNEERCRVGIPAKANTDSEGNANGIPGRRRTVSERSDAGLFEQLVESFLDVPFNFICLNADFHENDHRFQLKSINVPKPNEGTCGVIAQPTGCLSRPALNLVPRRAAR